MAAQETELKSLPAQPVASVRVTTSAAELASTLGEILPEVWAYLQASGVAPAGPPFARYHAMENDRFDLEAGLPVAAPVKDSGRIKPGELPGGAAVAVWHIGPYEDLPAAHLALESWLAEHRRSRRGGPWEVYWTDPGEVTDPAQWRTEVVQPLAE